MMRTFLVALCLIAMPVFAKDAVFRDGVLTIDSIKFGNETYSAQLQLVPDVLPETFVVTSGQMLPPATEHAAVYNGGALNIANVLVNGTIRVRANFILVGNDPLRFQLSSYSQLRAVDFINVVQALKPGSVFAVDYTGSILDKAKVKLSVGSAQLPANVVENTIVSTIPVGIVGDHTLTVELDGDRFELPINVQTSVAIANPTIYVNDQVNLIVSEIRDLGLPTDLLDVSTINNQLASLTADEARLVALQIRENFQPLLSQIEELLEGTGLPLQNSASHLAYALIQGSEFDCERWMRNFTKATVLAGAGVAATAAGLGVGIPGAIISGVGIASTVIAAEVAIRNMQLIVNECGALNNATFTLQPLQSEIVLTKEIEVYESRTSSFSIDGDIRLDQSIRSDYLATTSRLKTFMMAAIKVAEKIPFISKSSVTATLNALAADIQTNDIRSIVGEGHKFIIRAISDSSISGSLIPTGTENIAFLFDKKNEDLAEGKSVRFTIELYNSTDDISITVPVLLHGASMLEDLKRAALGNWTVQNLESNTIYDLTLLSGGKGIYKLPVTGGYCPNNPAPPVAGFCHYSMSWAIIKKGDKYVFHDYGFWHPAYNDPAIVDRTALTLPLTGFSIFLLPNTPSLRYTKQ